MMAAMREPFIKWFEKTASATDQMYFKTFLFNGFVECDGQTFDDILDLRKHFEKKYKRKG